MATYHSPFGRGFRPKFPRQSGLISPNRVSVHKTEGHNTAGRPKVAKRHWSHPVLLEPKRLAAVQAHIGRTPARHGASVHSHVVGMTTRIVTRRTLGR